MRPIHVSFCHCGLENEKGRIRCVKGWHVYFAMLATLMTSVVLAEDFKTITGKEYKDATITRVEGDGIVLRSKTGISKVYFSELPKDVQEKFHYAQATPTAVQHEREPSEIEAKQDGKASKSGRVIVVGHSSGSMKIFLAGIVLLLVVVLAIVRSRF